jgi:hypothetical protein
MLEGGLVTVFCRRAEGCEVSVCWRACDGFLQEGW